MTTGTLQRRSAWDLDTPVDKGLDWRQHAACVGQWDLFTGFLPTQVDEQAKAAHICRHCDVAGQCAIFSALHRNDGIVQAGLLWNNGRSFELPDPGHGAWCGRIQSPGPCPQCGMKHRRPGRSARCLRIGRREVTGAR
jgi:hypothetical protein